MTAEERAIAASEYFADLLEAAARGLKRKRHQKHLIPARAKIKSVMASFFSRQGKAILADIRPHIERQLLLHPQESITPAGKTFARSLLPTSLHPLTFKASESETSDYNDAITAAIEGAATTLTREAGLAKLAGEKLTSMSEQYLRDNSLSKLTGALDDTSIERLQDALATAWDKGGDYDSMVKAVADTFEDFSTTRAEMIAQTEGNDAYNYGRMATARDAGLDEKAWETESGDPCPTCIENEEAGYIGIDDSFPSGDDGPTAHPNCECSLNFRGGATDEEDES